MEVNMSSIAAQSSMLNKANIGHDILTKTLEKSKAAQAPLQGANLNSSPPQQIAGKGRINVYA